VGDFHVKESLKNIIALEAVAGFRQKPFLGF
jgi:hypothetical protein